MKLIVRKNTPLRPLARHAMKHSAEADELWVASAFLSDEAVAGVLEPALEAGASVRVLTGTFGRVTRLRTFKRLNRLGRTSALRTRIWLGDYHVKLFLWRAGRHGIAWIGSANLTGRGLQSNGELVAEITAAWNSPPMRTLRASFDGDWMDAHDLDDHFLRGYREAPRPVGLSPARRAHARPTRSRPRERRAMLVLPVGHHYADSSRARLRIDALLGATADLWYSSPAKALRLARKGDFCLVADGLDHSLCVGVVTDTVRDGRSYVIAYEPFTRLRDPRLGGRLRRKLVGLGLHETKLSFRSQWLDFKVATGVVGALYGAIVGRRFKRLYAAK